MSNRQTKRMMRRQGMDAPAGEQRRRAAAPARAVRERTKAKPREFAAGVRSELKKVVWPTRPEVVNSTAIVLVAVVVMTFIIFLFDFVFSNGVLFIFQ